MKLKMGIIGYRNHALRLMKIISKNKHSEITYVYHPYKKVDHPCATNQLQDLYQCDAVIISSPNQTHFSYIMDLLKHFKGYIFCEKPPVNNLADLERLSNIARSDKGRVYFNYNFRFGLLNTVLNDPDYLKKIGNIHHIKIISAHGLAFKKEYINSWRADGKNNLHAIAETVAIHFIDILRLNFGRIKTYSYNPHIIAKKGTAYDTAHIALDFNNVSASIFTSYASPYVDEISIIGTEGFLKICGGLLTLYSPRATFDAKGFFKKPPVVVRKHANNRKEYESSLKKSLDFFIYHVQRGEKIDAKYFEASLSSNRILLEIQAKQIKK